MINILWNQSCRAIVSFGGVIESRLSRMRIYLWDKTILLS